jgi:hypothetical protein
MVARGRGLNYYRGQYDPTDMYAGAGEAPIISMYNPQSQAQFIDAVAKRQERFDATKMALAQEKIRIGETETYDMAELTKRIKEFESGINSLVKDKYNGDYSAAANEIATKIGTERSNPFYHFNKQKVEMGKAYLDTKMKLGSNFMATANPFDVSFQDWQAGKTFDFTPVNREDIVKQAAVEFNSLKDVIQGNPKLLSTAGGQYFMSVIQRGIKDPTALTEYLDSPEGQKMIGNIMANNPVLAQLDPTQVKSAIFEGAHTAIGKTEIDYMADRGYEARLAGGTGGPGGTNMLAEVGRTEAPGDISDVASSKYWNHLKDPLAIKAAQKYGIPNITNYQDLLDYKEKYTSLLGASTFGGHDEKKKAKDALQDVSNILEDTLKKNSDIFTFPLYTFDTLKTNSKDLLQVTAVQKGLNEYVNNPSAMAANDFAGATPKDSKKLEGLTNKEVTGFFIVPPGDMSNPNDYFSIGLNIVGTPPKGKNEKGTPDPVQVKTMINKTSGYDVDNILGLLAKVDSGVLNMMLQRMELTTDPEKFKEFLTKSGIEYTTQQE